MGVCPEVTGSTLEEKDTFCRSQWPSCLGSDLIFMDRFSNGHLSNGQTKIRIELFQDAARLQELRNPWMNLMADAANPSMFISWQWISRWWQHFGEDDKLCIVLAYDGDWLVGLLPLMVMERKNLGVKWKMLTMIAAEFGADHLDMLVRREYEDLVPEKILTSVLKDHPTIDLFNLSSLDENGYCARAARKVHKGWIIEKGEPCPYIGLEPTWEEYARKGLDTRMGRKLRRAMRRVSSDLNGTMRIWRVKNERERNMALNSMFELHIEKWAARGKESIFADLDLQAFHHEMSAKLLRCGCLRMYVLSVGGTVVAVEYNIRCRDGIYSFQKAYSTAWKGYDPGYLLTQFAIQQSMSEGLAEFDLLRGDEDYKRFWATGVRFDQDYWLPVRFYGRVVWTMRELMHRVGLRFSHE